MKKGVIIIAMIASLFCIGIGTGEKYEVKEQTGHQSYMHSDPSGW